MNITISEKSPVYGKLVALGHKLSLDPSLLAAGMCHAALNSPSSHNSYQPPVPPVQAPVPTAAPATTPAPEPPAAQAPQPAAAGSSGMFDNIPA